MAHAVSQFRNSCKNALKNSMASLSRTTTRTHRLKQIVEQWEDELLGGLLVGDVGIGVALGSVALDAAEEGEKDLAKLAVLIRLVHQSSRVLRRPKARKRN